MTIRGVTVDTVLGRVRGYYGIIDPADLATPELSAFPKEEFELILSDRRNCHFKLHHFPAGSADQAKAVLPSQFILLDYFNQEQLDSISVFSDERVTRFSAIEVSRHIASRRFTEACLLLAFFKRFDSAIIFDMQRTKCAALHRLSRYARCYNEAKALRSLEGISIRLHRKGDGAPSYSISCNTPIVMIGRPKPHWVKTLLDDHLTRTDHIALAS